MPVYVLRSPGVLAIATSPPPRPPMVIVGFPINDSFATIVTVISLPLFAHVGLATKFIVLLEDISIVFNTGGVLSIRILLLADVTVVVLPAKSTAV